MPNGQTDYEKWYAKLPGWLRGLAKPPPEYAKFKGPPAEPTGPAQVSPYAWEVLRGLTPEEQARLPVPIPEESLGAQIARRKKAEEEAAKVGLTGLGVEVPPFPTEPPPEGFRWAFDRDLNRWVPQFAGLTPQQEAQREGFPAPGQPPVDPFGRQGIWNPRTGQYDYPPTYGQRPADQPAPISPFQRQQFGLQRQQVAQQQQQFQQQLGFQQQQAQMAQAEQERQYISQLAANPMSWLQYASYTGQEPIVQPWMVPLGAQGAETSLQVGQPIPGFEGQAGQRQIQTFADLPQLRTPSAQLQARWGPTAQSQFLGYRQARTGARPEETQFRLGAGRAPTGRFGGFSRFR